MTEHADLRTESRATSERIVQLLHDPRALEALYRQDPRAFRRSLDEASRMAPESVALGVWRARLECDAPGVGAAWRLKLAQAMAIALVFGALVRLPALWLGEESYYPRLAPSLVVLALSAYFWMARRDRGRLLAGLLLAIASAVHVWRLPGSIDSVAMVLIHLPIVFWVFLGFVFTGDAWRTSDARIDFLRYNGELLVLACLVALGGVVFSAVTVALLQLVSDRMGEWYVENIAIFGLVAVPVAATFLYDVVFQVRTRIAAVLARVFAPLFLVMSTAYLSIAFVGGQNPFLDRSFLIAFNGLLLVVLGITVMSIVERGDSPRMGLTDSINFALVAVTLLIDAIALSAIVFRLASFGFTPNRVVVLGANLTIMVHLSWLFGTYVGLVRQRSGVADLRRVVASYLPVYGIWAAAVAFVLPFVFRSA